MSKFYTVVKGSIHMPGKRIVRAGDTLTPEDFKGYEKNLATLLASGTIREGKAEREAFNPERGRDLPPIPAEVLDVKGKRQLASKVKDIGVQKKLEGIKAKQKANKERQAQLQEHEGEEMTLAEAKAHGVV